MKPNKKPENQAWRSKAEAPRWQRPGGCPGTAKGRRGGGFLPEVSFCSAVSVESWKGPQLSLPSGNCSPPSLHPWSPSCPPLPLGQLRDISLVPAERVPLFFAALGMKTSCSTASILLPSQAPGSFRRGKMHSREYFCIQRGRMHCSRGYSCACSSLQSLLAEWGGLVPIYQQRIPLILGDSVDLTRVDTEGCGEGLAEG